MDAGLISGLRRAMPDLRGTLEAGVPLAPLSWFKTGGPAQALFSPADEVDLA
ncbi:MAG: UDP-N-acetylenolpyruvoylglucosamine reductase, partial [Beijerinckiaceae bacterium]|nr:UDP-N-acetylenolpyruvoylglucosamine reductase [Beijerinckiaceae bacterium]